MATSFAVKKLNINGRSGGILATVPVSAAGTGFTSVPTVALTGGTFQTTASGSGTGYHGTVTANLTATSVNTSFTIVSGGAGYKFAPSVRLVSADGNGSGATATAALTSGVVTSITRTAAGTGYTAPPIVIIEGGEPDRPAQVTSLLTATTVASLSIVDPGLNYATAPTVTISGGGGTGATCTTPTVTAVTNINNVAVEYWGGDTWRWNVGGRWLKYTGEDADVNALLKLAFLGGAGFAAADKLFGTTV